MKELSLLLLFLILLFSLINFVLCLVDKRAAQKNFRRIPERRFFLFALLGGGPGLWAGMRCFRHKTLHRSFWFVAISTTVLYIVLLVFLALKIGRAI